MKYLLKLHYTIGICLACSVLALSCSKDKDYRLTQSSTNPVANRLDPGAAASNTMLTITGSGLGDIRSIVFDSGHVRASFNPTFNTDNTIMFRVPADAIPGEQNIVLTNGLGKEVKLPFKVLGFATITGVSNYNFAANSQITLTGKNLDDVTKVLLHGTTEEATIVSKTKTSLVLTFPNSSLDKATLDITNGAGTITTTQEFINVDKAYGIFKDAFSTDIDDWSWGLVNAPSAENVKTGIASLKAQYTGSWGGMQLSFKNQVDLTPYKYVAFWIKGAAVETKITFNFNWANSQTLTIPANDWKYFKIDLNTFKGAGVSKLDKFIMQINGDGQTLYMDDIILIK